MKRKSITLIFLMVVVSFLIMTISCNNIKREWEKAQQQNTIESYNSFIEKHPESEFTENAKNKIIELEWANAQKINNIEAYKSFISKNPQNQYVKEANSKIEMIEWDNAFSKPNIDTLANYIKKYPLSPNISRAKEEMSKLKWPPTDIKVANKLIIWSKGKQSSYGGIELVEIFGVVYGVASDDKTIVIWRDLTPEQEASSLKNCLFAGIAYLRLSNGKYQFVKKIDLQKTDNQLKKEFSIVEI